MPTEVILPRVDMDMATGSISRWFVGDGETVEKGAVLFEIETDKAAMEIDAPATGRVHRLAADDGTAIPVGARVAWILAEGEKAPEDGPSAPADGDPAKAAGLPEAMPVDVGGRADTRVPDSELPAHRESAESCRTSAPRNRPPACHPLARRLARDRRIDLQGLTGSGPSGRIQSRDVEAAIAAADVEAAKAPPAVLQARSAAEQPAPMSDTRPARPADGTLHRVWMRRGTGTPLVLIHGFGSESGMWRPLIAALPEDRPVLAVDLPAHGLSPSLATNFAAIVEAVADTLAQEAVAEAHLAGHSLGSAVAAALADGGSLGVRSLFLLSPAGLGPDIDAGFLAGFTRARDAASLAPWMRLLVHDGESLPQSLVSATARSRAERDLVDAQAALAEDLFPDATQIFSVRQALERIAVPTRVIFGLADRIIPARHASGLPGMIAVHLFPKVGHMPHLEVRESVARLLADHLR